MLISFEAKFKGFLNDLTDFWSLGLFCNLFEGEKGLKEAKESTDI